MKLKLWDSVSFIWMVVGESWASRISVGSLTLGQKNSLMFGKCHINKYLNKEKKTLKDPDFHKNNVSRENVLENSWSWQKAD